ncbi:MAG: hypothetical protein ACPGJM_10000, partial [Paracoccaceae bacterium]
FYRWRVFCMSDNEKQALRNSMAGKKVSEMTTQERELFDQEFQYGLNDTPQKIKSANIKGAVRQIGSSIKSLGKL